MRDLFLDVFWKGCGSGGGEDEQDVPVDVLSQQGGGGEGGGEDYPPDDAGDGEWAEGG